MFHLRLSVCWSLCLGLVGAVGFPAHAQEVVPGEVIVKMKGKPSGSKSQAFMGRVQGKMALKATFGRLNMHHMSLAPGQDLKQVLQDLNSDPDIEYAEPNYILRKVASPAEPQGIPRMTAAQAQAAAAQNQAQSGGTNSAQGTYSQSGTDSQTQVTAAWSRMTSSVPDEPIVAIVDTGVDYTHPVFANSGAIWTNAGEMGVDSNGHSRATNGIDDDGNGFIDDFRGWNFHDHSNNPMDDEDHGSHVAGIVLGVTQDILATNVAAAKIRLMPLKFLGADGSGSTSDAVAAIYYAVNNGANVINNSWGGGSYSQALHDAMAYAYTHNVVLVTAAGNNASDNDSTAMYPANYPVPSMISVAAMTDWASLASFSNYGAGTVHMGAPGVAIRSTLRGGSFGDMSGTSMASPFVAGVVALAWREAPNLSSYQIRNLVVNAGSKVSSLATTTISGGMADALQTVVSAQSQNGVSASQPGYDAMAPAGYRAPASDSGSAKSGCGLVSTSVMTKTMNGDGRGGGGGDDSPLGLILGMTLLPLLVWQMVRTRAQNPVQRRVHERFVMNSEIKVRMGDRELTGQMNTISMGGLSFKADALLERGGIVTLQIASPDGSEQVQVEGRIVWSEQSKGYGVQFAGAEDTALSRIRGWTQGLVKAS